MVCGAKDSSADAERESEAAERGAERDKAVATGLDRKLGAPSGFCGAAAKEQGRRAERDEDKQRTHLE